MDKIINYCKAHPTQFYILCGLAILIVLAILGLIISSAVKRKKAKKQAAAPVPPPSAPIIQEEEPKKEIVEEVIKPQEKKVASPKKSTATNKRYPGKWIICRIVNGDKDGNAVENGEEMFFFELHASNGEKLLSSEEYTSYQGAIAGISTHKTNIEKGNFKITISKKGDYIFKLLNGKNMLLCMGEHYASRVRCESAIESTKRFALSAVLDENVQDLIIPYSEEEETPPAKIDENMHGKWIIRTSGEGEEKVYFFELVASNGERLLSSEEYTTYAGALNGIQTHKQNIEKNRFRVSYTKRGDYIYKLLNGNGQLLCLGEHYKTRTRCENAIESVKRFAKNASVLADSKTVKNNG